jgi:transposase
MYHIRTTKTSSGATAVQILRYENRKKIIVIHIGSAHNTNELNTLKQTAAAWIEKTTKQPTLFGSALRSHVVSLDKCEYLGFRYGLLYETLSKLFIVFKFHLLKQPLLMDLVIARMTEPQSKLQSLEFLQQFFSIKHHRAELYRHLTTFTNLQQQVEAHVMAVAKNEFHFDCSLVFYDVTTLYFESFEPDELRKHGFSKDNKAQQPQIVIGLLVTSDGFPVAYQIFEGNTFEGHTLIPVISAFKRTHAIETLTVVADAAMINLQNIIALKDSGLRYIVGARIGSLSPKLIATISARLHQRDGATIRIATDYGDLVCDFSAKRFTKDKREMDKQIKKAEHLLRNPSVMKRTKFIKIKNNTTYEFNKNLMEKTTMLLGLKGYYTNLGPETSDQTIIQQYHNLWHVEWAFRIAKSDLRMRPIYHFKEKTIKAHILICFMALAVCKYMELKTGVSIKHGIKLLKGITDARLLNTLTNEEIILRSKINEDVQQLLIRLGLWY